MSSLRDLITLVEDKSKDKLEQADLPYSRRALSPVLSKSNVDNHYGKLYKGYVDRFNKKEGDRNFNEAGAYLHKIYFTAYITSFTSFTVRGTSGSAAFTRFPA